MHGLPWEAMAAADLAPELEEPSVPAHAVRHWLPIDDFRLHLLEISGQPGPATLLLPGFFRRAESDTHLAMALRLARNGAVYNLDFRGHGESEGVYTFGHRETEDVEAALGFLRERGHDPIHVVGLSMGGYLAIRTLGERPGAWPEVDALVVISTPSRWGGIWPRLDPRLPFQARVPRGDAVRPPRVRLGDLFGPRTEALDVVADLPCPLQIHHHRGDWLIRFRLGEELAERARDPKEFHVYGGDLRVDHADHLVRNHFDEILDRVEAWFARPGAPGVEAPSGLA